MWWLTFLSSSYYDNYCYFILYLYFCSFLLWVCNNINDLWKTQTSLSPSLKSKKESRCHLMTSLLDNTRRILKAHYINLDLCFFFFFHSHTGICIGNTDSRHFRELTHNIYRFAPVWFKPGDAQRWEVCIDGKLRGNWRLWNIKFYFDYNLHFFSSSDSMASMKGFPKRTMRSCSCFTSIWFRIAIFRGFLSLTAQLMSSR